jgi:4-amino-4-deoxy-L-arabinose transferase-like glycosyltransferase
MKQSIQANLGVWVVTALFAILGTIYSLNTPLFEASDEISHYPVVEHIATEWSLPVQEVGVDTLWEQEGSQPPLYYMMSAALTFWIDTSDLTTIRWRNPHAKLGIPLDPDNRNMVLHTEAEHFPWKGTVLAVRLIRFFSVLLGTGTVAFTYFIAKEVWPDHRWFPTLAAAIAAFNPMFLFITGSVNNDNLTVLLASWVIWLCIRILKHGLSRPGAEILAVVASLATIAKISGLTLMPLIGVIFLIHAIKTGEWRRTIYAGLTLTIAWLILGSWWYVRNIRLYHELFGLNTHVAIVGGRTIDLVTVIQNEWYGFWVSYWGLFGAVNIMPDPVVYQVYWWLSWIAAIGFVIWLVKRIRRQAWDELLLVGFLVLQVAVVLIGLLRWTMMTYASQGRLMFPAIAALSTLMALGLMHVVPRVSRTATAILLSAAFFLIALIIPFRTIQPVYAQPPGVADIPATAHRTLTRFNGLDLLAVEVEPIVVEEGGRIPVTLYWRTDEKLNENYSIYLHALGRDYAVIGKIDSYPGGGSLPSTRMEPGVIYADHYSLELDPDFPAPTRVRILIGAAQRSDESFVVIDPAALGGSPGAAVVEAGVAYPDQMIGCTLTMERVERIATLGGFAELLVDQIDVTAQAGDTIPVELIWDRIGDTADNWTVFVHLNATNGTTVAQADAPPLGDFYPTSLWKRSCRVLDKHMLTLPAEIRPGTYRIMVGMYNPADAAFPRAVAANMDGEIYPDYAIPIGTIEVTSR